MIIHISFISFCKDTSGIVNAPEEKFVDYATVALNKNIKVISLKSNKTYYSSY